jgi:hypothetical protein
MFAFYLYFLFLLTVSGQFSDPTERPYIITFQTSTKARKSLGSKYPDHFERGDKRSSSLGAPLIPSCSQVPVQMAEVSSPLSSLIQTPCSGRTNCPSCGRSSGKTRSRSTSQCGSSFDISSSDVRKPEVTSQERPSGTAPWPMSTKYSERAIPSKPSASPTGAKTTSEPSSK